MLWKHPTSSSYQSYSWVSSLADPQVTRFSEVNGMYQLLFFYLMTLTLIYELDLDNLPLDLHARIQVCMYVCSAGRVRRTHRHRHTHRRCQNYYTYHVRDVGCNELHHFQLVKLYIMSIILFLDKISTGKIIWRTIIWLDPRDVSRPLHLFTAWQNLWIKEENW